MPASRGCARCSARSSGSPASSPPTALLLGAVLVVLEANTRNALVEAVLRAADWADLGVFSRTAGVKQFTGDGAAVKNAITNWGLGAVAWLVVGRVARRILTP